MLSCQTKNPKKKITKWVSKSIHRYVFVWDKDIPPSDQNNSGPLVEFPCPTPIHMKDT